MKLTKELISTVLAYSDEYTEYQILLAVVPYVTKKNDIYADTIEQFENNYRRYFRYLRRSLCDYLIKNCYDEKQLKTICSKVIEVDNELDSISSAFDYNNINQHKSLLLDYDKI